MLGDEFQLNTDDGTRLHVRRWQPAGATAGAVVIVHGLGEHSGRYEFVAGRLTQAGYLVLAYDQRGHGKTVGPRGHVRGYDTLLDDLQAVVIETHRHGGDLPVFLYGHSLGGNLVLNFALRRRAELAGLVVTSPLLRTTHAVPRWKRVAARVLSRVWPAFSFDTGIDPKLLSRDPSAVQAYLDDNDVHHQVSARLATQMFDAGEWALRHSSELRLPLLLIHGGADEVTSAQASREFAGRVESDCEAKIWEGLFHDPHWEIERDDVLSSIVSWLTSQAC